MKTIATLIAALAVAASVTAPAVAAADSDCSRVLSRHGVKAFYTCLDQNKH